MNKTKLRNYAPQARRDFIQAITDRAAFYGLTAKAIEPVTAEQGDVAIIGGRAFPRSVLANRERLINRIGQNGFAQTMEAIAYTWFNRFVAIRFMELHGYLDHGYRVLSTTTDFTDNTDGLRTSVLSVKSVVKTPEILLHAEHIELPGLNRDKVIELKLDGTKEAELYRLLLVAQCNALSAAMPFLFERVDDESELLLPDNLLHSDSLIRKLVNEIDESDWQQVEIIGWLYQFYISEKKDEVIGKVVKSEDIPAATQLFTPNWIVKYLVQNSIGRMWLQTYPASLLRSKMEYYIESQKSEGGMMNEENNSSFIIPPSSLSPEAITVLDPACGSGHILVEAYDLLKEIYLERGYRLRDIPRLILSKNLFGLDIDDRAAQLASFALLMKARADDRRIFERMNEERGMMKPANSSFIIHTSSLPNVLTIPDSSALTLRPHQLAETLFSDEARRGAVPIRQNNYMFGEMEAQPSLLMVDDSANPKSAIRNPQSAITEQHIIELLESFEMGKTLGSLIRLPAGYGTTLAAIAELVADKSANGDIYEKIAARQIQPFVRAAELLHAKYDCVIANPPYMGGKGMNAAVKDFAKRQFPDSKSDLFAMFIERVMEMVRPNGEAGFVTPFVWMFISSYEKFRSNLIRENVISSLIQLEYNAFEPACVPVCTFTVTKGKNERYKGEFIKLSDFKGHQTQAPKTLEAINNPKCGWRFRASSNDFKKIPESPIAFWVSDKVRKIFQDHQTLEELGKPRSGITTGDNGLYLRYWFEITKFNKAITGSEYAPETFDKWVPLNGGSDYRKWYGSNFQVINWENKGYEIVNNPASTIANPEFQFKPGVTWSKITSAKLSVRLTGYGFIFSAVGLKSFPDEENIKYVCGFLNSVVVEYFKPIFSSTLSILSGDIANLPLAISDKKVMVGEIVEEAVNIARAEWDSFETSWDFQTFPLLRSDLKAATVEQSSLNWQHACQANIKRMQELETENNRLFIDAYGLQDELSPEVPEAQITLARADRSEDTKRLLSYALGCMMGRYSLDRAGLVYADSGNQDFEKIYYSTTDSTNNTDEKQAALSAPSIVNSTKDAKAIDENQSVSSVLSVVHFSPDADGIVPVTEIEWFADDAANRLVEFVGKAWSTDRCSTGSVSDLTAPNVAVADEQVAHAPRTATGSLLEDNLRWIAESLGTVRDEDARTTIRRYFAAGFFKDHLKSYKKRPIYWLFSSGKQRAFQCLVYLHRYNEGTLARMRMEYVIPLQGKIAARITQLENDKEAATSTSHRKKLEKEQDSLKKQQIELISFDEKLRHYADQRIALDLDDGVKVNYGKFGDLLAEVKAVTGGIEE